MSRRNSSVHRSDLERCVDVARYYDEKTQRILDKYGPGPRVHYHTGLDAEAPRAGASLAELRAQMVSAQERLLREIASEVAGPRILDVGCGLGGTAIYLATKLNVEVTAITNVEPHVAAVSEFANDAHVGDLVHARVQDAHDVSDLHPFDNVVAVESSCYLDRHRWFAALSHVVRPRGLVHVVDCFLNDAKVEARFNAYWRTRIGRISEYVSAARAGGFVVRRVHPLNDRTLGFWTLSNTWTRDQLDDMDAPERTRLQRSYEEHAWLRDALASNSIQYAFVSFALDPG